MKPFKPLLIRYLSSSPSRFAISGFLLNPIDLRVIGKILASDNAVSLDAVVARMMGCEPGKLRFLQKAKELGLGDYAMDKIEITGEPEPVPDFKLPPLGGEASASNTALQQVLESRARLLPQADPELCTGCGACVDQCPVGALSLVEADTCITCFCCQEMCPEKAMHLQ